VKKYYPPFREIHARKNIRYNCAKDGTLTTAQKKIAAEDIEKALAEAKDDGWDIGVLEKPRRLKFTGVEKVNYAVKPADATQYLELLFDNELVDTVIKFTNAKAVKLSNKDRPHKRRSPLKDFKAITPAEFRQFLKLCMLIDNVAMPSMKHYWKQKEATEV
jgi:hypothetical protein